MIPAISKVPGAAVHDWSCDRQVMDLAAIDEKWEEDYW